MDLLASKWVLLLIPLLEKGPLRNAELLRLVDGISQKMLTETLRELEAYGLVGRHDYQTVPPKVDYRLTELGKSLGTSFRCWINGLSTISTKQQRRASAS